jgi:tetratricopeptide (TPR) repeat protein
MPPIRRLLQGAIVTAFIAGSCSAQREPPNLNRTDAQSVLLHQIRWESERTKKLGHMEAFAAQYPNDEAIGWVYEQMYNIYVDEKMVDRALALGEKLMAMDQEEVELAYKNLKLAEGKKDPALIKRWAEAAAASARCVLAAPQKTEMGARRLELAPQVLSYTEYLEYTDILRTTNRAKRLELMAEFLECNPKSIYAPAVQRLSLTTWREIDPGKALAIAEKIVEKDQTNEDALIMVAEHYMLRERDLDRVTSYSEKVIALVEQGTRLEGISDADWAKKKGLLTGRANWLIGSVAMQQNRFSQADRSLRAALPYLRGDSRLNSAALFYLGWANYKIGNVADALRFNQECARSKGPYQDQAAKNLAVIRAENPSHP